MKTSLKFLVVGFVALALASPMSVSAQAVDPTQIQDTTPGLNPILGNSSPVLAWNAFLCDHYYRPYAPQGAHQLAELSAAVHDALNTIDKRFEFFIGDASDATSADITTRRRQRIQVANADAAVTGVYKTLLPILWKDLQRYQSPKPFYVFDDSGLATLQAQLDAFVTARLSAAQTAAGPRVTQEQINDGVAIGRAAALAVHKARKDDGHSRYQFYQPNPPIKDEFMGQWKTIGSNAMDYAQYSDIKPFALDAITNYFAPPPPALNDTSYLQDLKEIKYKGTNGYGSAGVQSTTLPAELDLGNWVSYIGADVMNNYWLQQLLNRDYQKIVRDNWSTARLFALLQIATLDANVVNQYNKRIYNFWRPRDALLSTKNPPCPNDYLDADGNPQADKDCLTSIRVGTTCSQSNCWTPNVDYQPLTNTNTAFQGIAPNTPDYPAGLPTQVAAATSIISMALKLDLNKPFPGGPLTVQYNTNVNAVTFTSLGQINQVSVDGSVFSGNHLRGSGNAGVAQGTIVAREVYANVLQKPGFGRVRRVFNFLINNFDW